MQQIKYFWRKTTPRKKIQLGFILLVAGLLVFFGLKKLGVFASTIGQVSNTAILTYTQNSITKTVQSNTLVIPIETPAPTPTPTSTPTPTTSSITIKVNLQGRTNYSSTGNTFTVYTPGTTTVIYQKTDVSTDSTGTASFVVTDMTDGTRYDFSFKPTKFLSSKLSNQAYSDSTTFDFGILKTGDLNSDNIVNSLDFASLNGKWLTNDVAADVNGDGIVNTIDFSLMNGNWLATGQ